MISNLNGVDLDRIVVRTICENRRQPTILRLSAIPGQPHLCHVECAACAETWDTTLRQAGTMGRFEPVGVSR